jgi:hypothetical protein
VKRRDGQELAAARLKKIWFDQLAPGKKSIPRLNQNTSGLASGSTE